MNGPRLALVADDPRLASAVLAHLEKTLGLVLWQCSYEGIRKYPAPEADGLLLLASGSAADSEQVHRFVQEVYLQKLPILLLVVEADGGRAGKNLGRLDSYVARRLHWPNDAAVLSQFVRERAAHIPHATAVDEETIEETVRRRLLSQTPSLAPLTERIALAAHHDVTVLLTGETGTGKTFLARLLHDCSRRKAHPFLVVPCARSRRICWKAPSSATSAAPSPVRIGPRSGSLKRPAKAPYYWMKLIRLVWNSRPDCCV